MTEEEEFKKIMLDFTDVNPACPESVRRYGERCALAGETYYGMIYAEKEVKDELITAYEDILTCNHVESWCDIHSIPNENAIKIANRLLELDHNNVIATNTLDRLNLLNGK
jgi:hypothetical protein